MGGTLYHRLKLVEEIYKGIEHTVRSLKSNMEKFKGLPGFSDFSIDYTQIDVSKAQRAVMEGCKGNPILSDAIQGRQTVEESLLELAEVNKGIRRFLPRKKDDSHNERLEYLGELLPKLGHLIANGAWFPDNLVTGAVESAALVFLAAYISVKFLMPGMYADPDPAIIAQDARMYQMLVPALTSAFIAPVVGLGANQGRFTALPTEEARYLDEKVQEFYG